MATSPTYLRHVHLLFLPSRFDYQAFVTNLFLDHTQHTAPTRKRHESNGPPIVAIDPKTTLPTSLHVVVHHTNLPVWRKSPRTVAHDPNALLTAVSSKPARCGLKSVHPRTYTTSSFTSTFAMN